MSMTMQAPGRRPVGEMLRGWRERRRLSQLDLAIQADISARHLSFVETGRSRPTPAMILRLTEQLDVPLRERNTLLLAGGYAPAYPQHGLDEPELASVRVALRQVLAGHLPYPAVIIDRWSHLLTQLSHRARALGDQRLRDLHSELLGYPGGGEEPVSPTGVVLPLRYRLGEAELSLFSISAAVDTATDVTVEELSIESFYPADGT